jgi:uncharacterized protein
MVEQALRGVVREALVRIAPKGLPGAHHFYITFKTRAPGVKVSPEIAGKHPDEMTIVLEHQFWDLEVKDEAFAVTLSFDNRPERLAVPFAAITAFADPSVKFGLQFQIAQPAPAETPTKRGKTPLKAVVPAEKAAADANAKPDKVVALDAFRKK